MCDCGANRYNHAMSIKIVQSNSQTLSERLQVFRQTVPVKNQLIQGHEWTYFDTDEASGKDVILLLAGGGGGAESMFPYIIGFSEHFRVIAPDIPPSIRHIDDAVNGLHALLSAEHIERVILVGFSFGAMLAQVYIRRFQDQVTDMVITHSLIPSDHLAEVTKTQKNLMSLYPAPLLMWMSKRSYRRAIETSSSQTSKESRRFWQSYFDDLYGGVITKRHLVARARMVAEYHSQQEFNSRDLLQWHGNLLLIESDEDSVIGDGNRGSFLMMYSRAYVQTLQGYDHLAPLLACDEIVRSIRNFLLKEDD